MENPIQVNPSSSSSERRPKSISRRDDFFFFQRSNMKIAAMYPLFAEMSSYPESWKTICRWLDVIYEAITYLATIHIAILYALTLYISYNAGDLEFLVNSLMQLIIYVWTIAMKIHFRRILPNLLKDIMDSINLECRIRSAEGFTYVTMNESAAFASKLLKIYVISCHAGTLCWVLLPIVYGDRTLPLACWYPFDSNQPIVYETMYFFQFIGQIQVSSAFSSSSGFHAILAILISGQYDILNCSLKNIVATSYMKMGASRKDLRELEKLQRIHSSERNQYYCAKEHAGDYMHSPHLPLATPSLTMVEEKPQSFVEAFKISFKDCMEHHVFIVRVLWKMEKFYNFIWLVKFGEVILLLCLVAFVSVKSSAANSSFMKMLSLAQYMMLVIVELFIICYFGEIIHQMSQKSGDALLRCPWYLHMREMKQDILIFIMNSQRAFTLTAGKMFSLDIPRFRVAMTTAFSFLTILQKMDQRN